MNVSERAIDYVLERVQRDPSFAWHMVGTQTLALCVQAAAEFRGGEAPPRRGRR